MSRSMRGVLVGALTALVVAAGVPAAASAAKLFVSSTTGSPGRSCAASGFSQIQTAINAANPGDTVVVCGGPYQEQLTISKNITLLGKESASVTLPAAPAGGTECDAATAYALVQICNGADVAIKSVGLKASFSPCPGSRQFVIFVGGGATLTATKSQLEGPGCSESAVALEVGRGFTGQVGHASLTKDTITGYGKNGVTVDGAGSTANVTGVTITGAGSGLVGQNGIQVSRGATATITRAHVSNNTCAENAGCGDTAENQWEEDGAGVLVYQGAATVGKSELKDNDIGVEYVSAGATLPASPELTLTRNKVTGGFASVEISQGRALLERNKLSEGDYGLVVAFDKFASEEGTGEYAPEATSKGDKIQGAKGAVEVEPFLGLAGKLVLAGDKLSGSVTNLDEPAFVVEQTP